MFRKSSILLPLMLTALYVFLFSSCGDDDPVSSDTKIPVLTTASVSGITQTTALCGGNITSDGGAAVTARGVCWSTTAAPTISDNKTTDGTGAGSYTSSITGLTTGTDYFARAYATNSIGTGYGNVQSFTTEASSSTVTDIDGNVYQTVTIGTQVWMAENLKVTKYRNGDPIPNVTNYSTWDALATGAYCNYNNDESHVAVYGRLYNWHAVDDSRNLAPDGWHVPTDEEWKQLEMYLGMSQAEADISGEWRGTYEGGMLKDSSTTYWWASNVGSNESGFTGLPGGYRSSLGGSFHQRGAGAFFWSCTEYDSTYAWYRWLGLETTEVYRTSSSMRSGRSVRCVKD